MKQICLIAISSFLVLASTPSLATSQDECAIFLCLPTGFHSSGCGGAKHAMKKRLKHGKSPLPPLHDCLTSSNHQNSTITSVDGYEVYIPGVQRCLINDGTGDGDDSSFTRDFSLNEKAYGKCQVIPGQWVKFKPGSAPDRCLDDMGSNMCQTRRFTTIYSNGVPVGQPYYW